MDVVDAVDVTGHSDQLISHLTNRQNNPRQRRDVFSQLAQMVAMNSPNPLPPTTAMFVGLFHTAQQRDFQ